MVKEELVPKTRRRERTAIAGDVDHIVRAGLIARLTIVVDHQERMTG